jgi:transmembrane sensor
MTHIHNAPPDPVQEQAISWVTRLHSGDCTDADRHAFAAWLVQDEAHRIVYREVNIFWDSLSQIEPHAGDQLTEARAYLRKARQPRRIITGKRLAGVLSIILIIGFSPRWWALITTDHYRTAKGESNSIQLSDGSHIDLNTDTELSVQYTWTTRSVKLEHGEALFSVVHDADKPFEVIAASGLIRDIGTRFNVYNQAGQVSVTVLEGEVSVAARHNSTPLNLTPGQQISYDATGQLSAIANADIAAITAWQKAQLVFKGQPLSVVLEQLGRYHEVKLQVTDPHLKALKVSGVFPSNNFNLALKTIAGALPVKVSSPASRVFVIDPAD